MYAIVDIAGQQFKAEAGRKLYVHRLEGEEGAVVEFDKVLLVDNDGDIQVGAPVVEGVKISAKVLAHVKGDKVWVFKKNRRKGYQKLNGHRQSFTQVLIENISVGGATKSKSKKAAPKTEAAPVVEVSAENTSEKAE